ncbi:NUDIX hydrolase [Gordonia jinghuaiqii]|uniref:NUDIX hydrolase n=1 Tax=Gordonia jinghuaiqii TaxID=2758710 RepID=A0A7D7QY59_9ACTN|nr:NUDIX domain-containing protein [Gordonia jinghuaiqii]MCR5977303.1 NUDIX hydrolase [Gordonia jinghuaiqii]QMT00111.1 NUDIX hydrolase [Gordonia jinghuaiqii]
MPAAGSEPPVADGTALRVEVLSVVLQIRPPATAETTAEPTLCVLLSESESEPASGSERASGSESGRWVLPGGGVGADETLSTSARRLVADTMDVREIAHLEQLSVFSDPHRVPGIRTIASTYMGLVPSDASASLPDAARWFAVDSLPAVAYDHGEIIDTARHRLAAKLSYTNIAFALAPKQFPMSQLSEIYCAALGYPVDTTNLLRILSRRAVVVATGTLGKTGRSGGRPPALYAFADTELRVTDEFATLRPPM